MQNALHSGRATPSMVTQLALATCAVNKPEKNIQDAAGCCCKNTKKKKMENEKLAIEENIFCAIFCSQRT